jgi:ABC-type transport system involved in multi-copper enzyme maturation permease subunit
MRNVWTVAFATYQDTARRPLYYILMGVFAVLIYCSHFLTLFTFNQEANMVREMGVASLALYGFLIFVILAPIVVTDELEDRTAITLLAKPLTRSAFLLGKYAGLLLSVFLGMLTLGGVLFFTLWWMSRGDLFGSEPGHALTCLLLALVLMVAAIVTNVRAVRRESDGARRLAFVLYVVASALLLLAATFASGDRDRADVVWQTASFRATSVWTVLASFMRENGVVIIEGFLLAFLQVGLLGSICVSLSAFLPAVVSVAGTALAFILGNLSNYLLASVEAGGSTVVKAVGRGIYYLMPNLGYFNLQTHFSEGSIISPAYLALAFLHAALYSTIVFLVSCSLFERREIR